MTLWLWGVRLCGVKMLVGGGICRMGSLFVLLYEWGADLVMALGGGAVTCRGYSCCFDLDSGTYGEYGYRGRLY